MKLVAKVKGFFKKEVEIVAESMHDLVEKLKWAEVEVEDTKDALLGLQLRLQHGVSTMEEIEDDAVAVINAHQAILDKASSRKQEFRGQVAQVDLAIKTVGNIYNS